MRNSVRLMQVPTTVLSHALLIGVHWKMLMRKAEPYAPIMSKMVPQIATLVTLTTGSVETEHRERYSKHRESLDSGVVSLNKI